MRTPQALLTVAERSFPADDIRVATSLSHLSFSMLSGSDPAGGEPLARKAVAILEKVSPRPADDLVMAYGFHSSCLCGLEEVRWRQEAAVRKALVVMEEVHGHDAPVTAFLYRGLGELNDEQGRPKEAEPLFRPALALAEKDANTANRKLELSRGAWLLGGVLLQLDRIEEAKPLLERGVRLSEELWGTKHPRLVGPLRGLAIGMRKSGQKQEAEALLRRALAIQESFPDHKINGVDKVVTEYASLLRELGREDEAQRLESQEK